MVLGDMGMVLGEHRSQGGGRCVVAKVVAGEMARL
jgi:hypothetical protein